MKVVTSVVNNPIFIELQYYTLKKYMKCDYEFIVFNDAKSFPDYSNGNNIKIKLEIMEICKKLNIPCINIPNDHHKIKKIPSLRIADSINFILEFQKMYPDKYLLLDSDMFLIDNFELSDYNNYECAVVLQSRNFRGFQVNYFWNGLYYFDFTKIKDIHLLNWDCSPGCDTGGMTYKWLNNKTKNIPNIDEIRNSDNIFHKDGIYYIKHLWSCTWNDSEMPDNIKHNEKLCSFIREDPRNQNEKFWCEIYDNKFLHYRAGSNWEKQNFAIQQMLTLKLRDCLL
jgi:hypothetical protein